MKLKEKITKDLSIAFNKSEKDILLVIDQFELFLNYSMVNNENNIIHVDHLGKFLMKPYRKIYLDKKRKENEHRTDTEN